MAADIAVPDAQEPESDRQVPVRGRLMEMLVHRMSAGKELGKALGPDRNYDRQADGGPYRVATAHPIPEAEGPLRVDAERLHLVERRRDRREMTVDGPLA